MSIVKSLAYFFTAFTIFAVMFYPMVITQARYDSYVQSELEKSGFCVRSDGIIHSPPLIIRVDTFSELVTIARGESSAGPMLPTIYYYQNAQADPQYGFYVFNIDMTVAYVFDTYVGPLAYITPTV